MKTATLILAAGKAIRIHGYPKQLLPIKRETILGRQLRQLRDRGLGEDISVITHRPKIASHSEGHAVPPGLHGCKVEAVLDLRHLWAERTIVLLGDVIYSKKAMDAIVGCPVDLRVFGNLYEIYAFSFSDRAADQVQVALRQTTDDWENYGRAEQRGNLRQLYEFLDDMPRGLPSKDRQINGQSFYRIGDYTTDIDLSKQFENFKHRVVAQKRLDDLGVAG